MMFYFNGRFSPRPVAAILTVVLPLNGVYPESEGRFKEPFEEGPPAAVSVRFTSKKKREI